MIADPRIALLLAEIDKGGPSSRGSTPLPEAGTLSGHPLTARTTEQAIVLADVLVSIYICLETVFLRISQHFENRLDRFVGFLGRLRCHTVGSVKAVALHLAPSFVSPWSVVQSVRGLSPSVLSSVLVLCLHGVLA
jgi:hypothetical protein